MVTIYGWRADHDAPSYWRLELPLGQLHDQYGLDAAPVDALDLPLPAPRSIVVGQRVIREDSSLGWKLLHLTGHRLVYELDDDLWRIHRDNARAYQVFNDPDVMERTNRNIALADLVTVSTEPLAEMVRNWNPNVVVLPNFIDAGVLEHQRSVRDRLTIGWAGGDSHKPDLEVAAPALRRVLDAHLEVDMHFMGKDYSDLVGRTARFSPWVRDIDDYQRSIDFDIGLAPLAPIKFNRCKSYIKALEYAALGIPTVASDWGPYAEFVEHGVTGFLAHDEGDWVRYLTLLINEPDARAELGAAARRKARDYTIQGNAYRWAIAYGELV